MGWLLRPKFLRSSLRCQTTSPSKPCAGILSRRSSATHPFPISFPNVQVTVQLTIQNRQAAVSIVPSASSMVLKALKEPPRDRKKVKNIKHDGNIPFDAVVDIARKMREKSMARELAGTVKEILGTVQVRFGGTFASLCLCVVSSQPAAEACDCLSLCGARHSASSLAPLLPSSLCGLLPFICKQDTCVRALLGCVTPRANPYPHSRVPLVLASRDIYSLSAPPSMACPPTT